MGRRQRQEDQQAADAATKAILRGLDRTPGLQRGVLAELSPAEQAEVFAAEARHNRR
jgi:hypothetical protein